MPDLGTIANILQVISSITLVVVAYRWGKEVIKNHLIGYWLMIGLLGLAALLSSASLAKNLGWFPLPAPVQVFDHHFKNEVVNADNHEFYNCVFENVEFVYAGGPYRFENMQVIAPVKITGTSFATVNMMRFLGLMNLLDRSKITDFRATQPR